MSTIDQKAAVAIEPAAAAALNPFAAQRRAAAAAGAEADNQRAIAEVQSAMIIAQRFPRDPILAVDNILQAFTRPSLAESAMYQYARGGQDITGPSIRAAETIAQCWGNIQYGVRELEQRNGESTVEAFAWDVQTNTRATRTFQVAHVRHTRSGQTKLTDPRDIYELVANQGSRRLRACILQIIPGDVVEAAVKQAETTLQTKVAITPELVQSLIDKFAQIGVSREALEVRAQRRIDAITPALVVQLGKIYNSIKDGMSVAADWFDVQPQDGAPKTRTDEAVELLRQQQAPPPSQHPSAPAPGPEPVGTVPSGDKKKRADLRAAVLEAWSGVDAKVRDAKLTESFGTAELIRLTAPQLEEFLGETPSLLAQIASGAQ